MVEMAASTNPELDLSILYSTEGDASRPSAENNGFYIGSMLAEMCRSVSYLSHEGYSTSEKALMGIRKCKARVRNQTYVAAVAPEVVERKARITNARAHVVGADVVFSNVPSAVSGVKARPYVLYADAPFAGLLRLGQYMDRWTFRSVDNALEMDRRAVLGACVTIYHSHWAADVAISEYGCDPARVKVVLPGANMSFVSDSPPPFHRRESCEVLFFGRDWHRKGGPKAVQIVRAMRDQGVNARLTVCGPPREDLGDLSDLSYVRWYAPLTKQYPRETDAMRDLFKDFDYLLLPTLADTSTSAIREAAAFGVPSAVTNVGGLGELVIDDVSGLVFDRDDTVQSVAVRLAENWSRDDGGRESWRHNARRRYVGHLNWRSAGSAIRTIITQYVPEVAAS